LKAPLSRRFFFTAMDGGYAGNAGAFSGGCLNRTTSSKRSHFRYTDTPKMQEHFPAGA